MAMSTLQPQVDGPLKVSGETEIFAADGSLLEHADELWLCRCGRSATKPYCDGSHKEVGFRDRGEVSAAYKPKSPEPQATGPVLKLSLRPNGPIRCLGDMRIDDPAGGCAWTGRQAFLCRCGESKNKPFCDGTHRESGFEGD
jgi:CDGSH-type Zn-finger protein